MNIPRLLLLIACISGISPWGMAAEKVSLFDGKSLDGWDYNPAVWRVEDGLITGGSTTEKIKANFFICTKQSYQNFELTMSIKCSGDPATGLINSGIQIRSVRVPGGTHMSGYQIDCGDNWFGKIYDEFRRNRVITDPVDPEALKKVVDVFGWNEYRIRAEGPRIQVWINGVLATDYTETDPNIALDGRIAPQVHSGGVALVQVKDVSITELPATANAPTWESLGGVEAAISKVAPPKKPKQAAAGKKDLKEGNAVAGQARTAAEQLPLFHLPEGYQIELVAQESEGIGKFISVYFDQRGRLWTQTALEYPVDANENPAVAEALYQGKGLDKVLVYPRESLNQPLPANGLTNPTIFAKDLAIPLGILPWGPGDACYTLHGHDLLLLTDNDGDGSADQREVILTGFGVQDSHLFPHQFTRAPGDWIWMAQGLFNQSEVKQPGSEATVAYPQCSMARMRPDGSQFEVTSTGPNNIWGLAITGEGEAFIQEANDYGYPVMPFHDYAYYPGGMAKHKRSYQPDFPATAEFRVGGTGLSGLAILESGPRLEQTAALTMLVANPITTKIHAIAMKRAGDDWSLEQLADFVSCDDPYFRPVAMTQGPDGSLYIVDWYNKIISHNEVPRNHPDRDKTRGRIWRIKATTPATNHGVPDFTKLASADLVAMLGQSPTARAHLARETLVDRKDPAKNELLKTALLSPDSSDARRIQALWALPAEAREAARPLLSSENRNLRRELARFPEFAEALSEDADREVRFAAILSMARELPDRAALLKLLARVKPALSEPTGPSSRGGAHILIGEAYNRAYERFLIRRFLEENRPALTTFLDGEDAATLSAEARILATLSLEPGEGAARLAKILPTLGRPPHQEEILLLAQHPETPGASAALDALLSSTEDVDFVAQTLLEFQATLDPDKVAPLLTEPVSRLLASPKVPLATKLIGTFRLTSLEPEVVALLSGENPPSPVSRLALVEALRLLRSDAVDLLAKIASGDDDPAIRNVALNALGDSRSPAAAAKLIQLYPSVSPTQQSRLLTALASRKAGAESLVDALLDGTLPKEALDGPAAEKLGTVLADSPKLTSLMESMGHLFRDLLALDGSPEAWTKPDIRLEGPFTVEAWMRLAAGITNQDGLLGSENQLSINFFDSHFRFYIQGKGDLVVAKRPMTPDLWTHLAVTRDASGILTLYNDGEIDATSSKPYTDALDHLKIGWTPVKGGTEGAISEFRVWNRALSPSEIRERFDRSFATDALPEGLTYYNPGGEKWGQLGTGAKLVKSTDGPPLLTTEAAAKLDIDYARLMRLGQKGGDITKGKAIAAICTSCHLIQGAGGQIGPELSGVGAMGLEAILRNILTPNAAMEAGYRIFRVELKNGDLVDSFFVSEDDKAVVIRQPGAPDRRIAKTEILATSYLRRSLMPEGLLTAFDDEMTADLLAYLLSLK
jgi:putative membrane-bound dehydrogenase-like protein